MTEATRSQQIVSRHKAVFAEPPRNTPAAGSVDGPLLGNGDMLAALGGDAGCLRFHINKNDLWRLQHACGKSSPVPFGQLTIDIPSLKNASYKVTQDLYTATTRGVFGRNGAAVHMNSYVAATEGLLILELTSVGQPFDVTVALQVAKGRGSDSESGREGEVFWGRRAFPKDVDIPSGAAVAWKALGLEKQPEDGLFVLKPDEPVTLVLAMKSVFKSSSYTEEAVKAVSDLADKACLSAVRQAHEQWWTAYWAKSYVNISDPIIEKQYYLSLYALGSCSRDTEFPPPLFGWTTTDDPLWEGDYHLNYNHQAPFYGLARANRLEQADPHDTPFLDFMERAAWHCSAIYGFDGGIYPVGIGPKGIETTYNAHEFYEFIEQVPTMVENRGLFFGQRTNGSYGLVNMAQRWYTTFDLDYGKKIYPFALQMATFWENYVTWDDGNRRFIIDKDSCHEGSGQDMNSCVSLALCRLTMQLTLDMSKELDADAERRKTWEHILKHLSGYTFQERDGKTVFRYTEKGMDWCDGNTIGIQQIYPAGQIDLDSDPELLAISRNTIELMQRWHDFNGSNSIFPAAVRIGYDSETILRELRTYAEHTRPNGFQEDNPHGIENLSTVPATINEMLCMGHKGVLRLFPVWPKSKDASFTNIRCWGAFLVSGELKGGQIGGVTIVSEKGRDCTLANPWPGRRVKLTRDGRAAEPLAGERFTFATRAGERLALAPA